MPGEISSTVPWNATWKQTMKEETLMMKTLSAAGNSAPAPETSDRPVPSSSPAEPGKPESDKDETAGFSAELSFLPFFNLALQQNAFPIHSDLTLINKTGHRLDSIRCEISTTPAFLSPKTVIAESLENGEERLISELDAVLDYDLLSSLSEAVKGKLKLEIFHGDTRLLLREYEVEAFAADQWLGLNRLPELLASFVTPNLDVVNRLQSVVSDELKAATGDPAIQGYQADRDRVYEICAAIYRAIHSWGIRYANPPSSFGPPGQRVRFADTIYQYRLGTCLDTALLFASVMEQCGLHPVLLLQEGHAYVGCHLVNRYFSDIPMDDLQIIRKLADLDEFLVIETTKVTGDTPFSVAEAVARTEHLNIDNKFQCAIDIVRARYSGIRPLPLRRSVNGIAFEEEEKRDVSELEREPRRELQKDIDLSGFENREERSGRVARWSRKLLDLSLRNRLLNVRDTRQVIPIVCSDITVLEDRIAADEMLSLHPLSNLLSEKDQHDLAMLRNSNVKNEIQLLLDKELAQRRLWTLLSPLELGRRLTALYRQARIDLEEGGVNTLFLAVGFLEWKISEREEKSFLAPILLIPIRLQRRSIAEGIRIARIDEDTVINETLLELLRTQFQLTIPGVVPLPADESGVDVKLVMQIFRQSIRNMKGWEVREEARIGHFSFGKFLMWNDMTARIDDLKRNPLIRHLMEGGGIFDDGIEVFPPEEVARHLKPEELYCPLSADSSQLAAVLYSRTGKSFVLHGPPGTGKSQTITNIIAHNLAHGRRVLFVSEKKAALDVVHRRLSSIGLRPFCLELHSSKSGKAEVLAQFSEALHIPDTPYPGTWETAAKSLETLRDELNEYVAELHRQFPNGRSAYDCFSRLFRGGPSLPEGSLNIDCLSQSRTELEALRSLVRDLGNAWNGTDPEAAAAFRELSVTDWSPVFEKEFLTAAEALLKSAEKLETCFTEQAAELRLPPDPRIERIYRTALLLEHLKSGGSVPAAFLTEEFAQQSGFLKNFAETMLRRRELARTLRNYHTERLNDLDLSGIAHRIEENSRAFFLIRFLKNRALLKELSGIRKIGGGRLSIPELLRQLPDFECWVKLSADLADGSSRAEKLLGNLWNGGEPDWDSLTPLVGRAQKTLELAKAAAENNPDQENELLETLRLLLPDAERRFGKEAPARKKINALLTAWNDFQEKQTAFASYALGITEKDSLTEIRDAVRTIIARRDGLRGALRYRKLRDEAGGQGISAFAEALENGTVKRAEIADAFERAFHEEMLNQILARTPLLCSFSGTAREERIRKFCELDANYTALSRQVIFARLASALPRRRSGPCPEGTELGILKRECEKRARQKPVRRLLEQIPTLAPVLKPCFLMSPLSVAQYLPPDAEPFDLIVFDEASQIPVWDAIGVIARGRQLIVVGDPKQMPPSDFFQKGENDENAPLPEETEDLESILDECIAAGVHPTYLNWHYRSRHESLISFSNHYYYEDRLFTFPAARDSERLGVRFEFVPDGVYDRRGTRTNRQEAEALVRYVFARLENPDWKPRSIGVVTFSQAQKELIEDRMEEERARHPGLESYFSDRNEEPLFVKNLENVQGDERDVILFSVGYAPDMEGKFSMNFGPLNRKGGERRLNVAITRAREQVVVFSSIHGHQIDLSRTGAVGAAHLKYFLDYAEKGIRIQPKSAAGVRRDGLIDTIAEFLENHNFTVERNIGCSGCRMDLAVRRPDRPSEFLLGIECDGAAYAAQKTTRDRDNLRTSVLRRLGWHIYHAWSVDWAFDRARAEQALLNLIETIRNAPEPPVEEKREPVQNQDVSPCEKARIPDPPPPSRPPEHRREYSVWIHSEVLAQESFYDPAALEQIRRQMRDVIQTEGPVCEQLLKKRIVKAWGFNRTGENILAILNTALPGEFEVTRIGSDRVYWPSGQTPAEFHDYRVSPEGTWKRSLEEIPPEELANAMYEVLVDFNSCEKDTLYRETVKLFGFSAVTAKARKSLDSGFLALKQSGKI